MICLEKRWCGFHLWWKHSNAVGIWVLGFDWWRCASGRGFGVGGYGRGLRGIVFLFLFNFTSLSVTLWGCGECEHGEALGSGGGG